MSIGILPNVTKSGCKFGAECSFPHWKVEEQPNKKPKKGDDKSAVAIVKSVRQVELCITRHCDAPAEMRRNLPGELLSSKKENTAPFNSPPEEWIMPSTSTINPEVVVDSGASMHMVSKKDLDKAELENVRISKNPIMVVTANGEVQTKEEATVCVRELDLFVTVMLLESTPAVLSLGKLCEEFGYSYHSTSGQKPHLIKNGKKILCDPSNHVPFVVLGL